jgi:D-glycero-alpha-D-manno-heptose-7-phosphate kinase
MIITRTPFRISFAGGGSDLPSYYSRRGGAVLSTAIDKYVYLAVKEHFGNTFRVSYSRTELVNTVEEIEHPLVRECLQHLGLRDGLEIVSMADLPSQSGIGSSSSFTVGLLHALYAMQGKVVTPERLARDACYIELDKLQEPIGKQDQYIAAYGGLQFIRFQPDGSVFIDPVVCRPETRLELNRRLLMFFTGMTRDAREVLGKQNGRADVNLDALEKLTALAGDLCHVLTLGSDLDRFGHLLDQAWQLKKDLEQSITNATINAIYDRARSAGALGGKLLGAGAGGFMLFYCEPHRQQRLREELAGLLEVPFALDPQGTKIVHIGGDHW